MPANLQTLLNIWGQGVRMERLLRSPQWRQGVAGLRRVVYELGQAIRMMQQQAAKPASPAAPAQPGTPQQGAEDLVNLANRLDALGAHAMADVLDMAVSELRKEAGRMSADRLVPLADRLDRAGCHDLADIMDRALRIVRSFDRKEPAEQPAVKPGHLTPLSTRCCPDHRGAQMARVGDSVFQCPVDRRTYNFEEGYTDYQGQRVPGGSVAGQTPASADYGGIPHRIFDTRENILNTLN
jgi:hypothetical protein